MKKILMLAAVIMSVLLWAQRPAHAATNTPEVTTTQGAVPARTCASQPKTFFGVRPDCGVFIPSITMTAAAQGNRVAGACINYWNGNWWTTQTIWVDWGDGWYTTIYFYTPTRSWSGCVYHNYAYVSGYNITETNDQCAQFITRYVYVY